VPVTRLLYGLMLYSGNDDALALAIAAGGSRGSFIAAMNRKARRLGLRDTRFTTPSGVVDRGNYSTPWDLAVLSRHALADERFRRIVGTRVKRFGGTAIYVNKNRLLGSYRGADGVKTGWTTAAGHCLVASARRNGIRLVAVVLGSRDAAGDAVSLLDYGFRTRG
jgi:D-alanyl-D-alanine carboxypeptidase